MANTIKIGNISISSFKVGSSDCSIYLGTTLLYSGGTTPPTPPTPTGCYEVIPDPITAYTSTTYDSVYSWSDNKWYMKNNLDQYEEYGVYDVVEDISSATTYEGKLAAVGTTEYEYSGDTWVEVGTYEDASVTYTIDDTDPSPYVGETLSTTFKIPETEMDNVGNFSIYDTNSGTLNVDANDYMYFGDNSYEGTVNLEGDYYYFTMLEIGEIEIQSIDYWSSDPIHLIVGSMQASVEYSAKTAPSSALTYSSVADMEVVGCPTVGVGQYCYTSDQTYKFTSNEEWVTAQDSEIMMRASDGSGDTRILACVYNEGAIPNKIAFDLNAVSAYFGSCVTSIGTNPFGSMYDKLESVTATSVVPPTIDANIFSTNTSKLRIYVPCNSVHTYRTAYGWKSYANTIDPIEQNCQAESFKARFYDVNDNLIGELQRTYNDAGTNITSAETAQYASSTYRVEIGDAFVRTQQGVFKGFTHITSLSFDNNVVHINGCLVSGCTALRTLELPSQYNSYLDADLITYCDSLQSITIPSGTTAIYRNTIHDCSSLQSITILKSNGVLLFWGTSGTVFQNTNNCLVYVPSNLVNSYKSASGWSTIASRIQAIPNS